MNDRPSLATPALTLFLLAASCAVVQAAQPVDFNREVRPILASNCLKCHGIDDGSRKAKLRLDVGETATAPAKSGKVAIVAGRVDESELARRIFSDDRDVVMPPASTHVTLAPAQKDVLRRWIAEGAHYETHWAFIAPRQVTPPDVKPKDWPRNAIDHFVLAKLEAEGLKPSAEADKYTLCRRAFLDLVGLPPTLAEVEQFVNDAAPDAYERTVDRLLASPHYGERWARRWLDLARYADTNGFEKDRPRSIWPYRDWVIAALNDDMPFDQFTVEQLAGDMLPNATASQRVATGFHRNTMLNEEGGIDPLEYRFRATVDRINTTGTTWLGLTVGCAQCHTHKYDPILHADYYRLLAFLNNANEPEMDLPSAEVDHRRHEIEAKIARLTGELPDKFPVGPRQDADAKWETPSAIVATAKGSKAEPSDEGALRFAGPSPDRDTYTLEFDTGAGDAIDRLRIEALRDGALGPGRTKHGNFVLTEVTVAVAPKDAPADLKEVKIARAEADAAQSGFDVAHAIDGDPSTGWAVDTGARPIPDRSATFFLDHPVSLPNGAHWVVKLDQQYGQQHTLRRVRLRTGHAVTAPEAPTTLPRDAARAAFAAWDARESAKAMRWTVLRPRAMRSSTPILTLMDDDSILASGDITKSDTYDLTFDGRDMHGITAVRLEALPDDSLPNHGPGMVYYEGPAGDFFLSEIALSADGAAAKFDKGTQSNPQSAAAAIDGDPQTGWRIDGGQGKPHVAVFKLAQPIRDAKDLNLHLLFERYHAAPLGHFRISVTTDPHAGAAAMPVDVEADLATPAASRSVAQREHLFGYFLSVAPELAGARKEIEALQKSLPKPTKTLVMRERIAGHARLTHVHHRGEYLQPTDEVQPGVPSFLPSLPPGEPANRLTFARWIASPENPLTARVAVNRQWQAFFGRGIVRTLEDFGYQGDVPTHPELLDWMAVEFVKQGWSLKKLHRLIVTSSTYRQSSNVAPDLLARDPQNLLLARGPRVRLEAELVRDSALRAAGLLSEKIAGPSVFPPQPASVTSEGTYGALAWTASTGEDRFRRSLYTYSKRTAPFALYNTFDAPTGEACLARRESSNTPLQALALLNDTVFMEAAQALGRAYGTSKEPDEQKATDVFRRIMVRPPSADELHMLTDFAAAQRKRFAEHETDAARVAGNGSGDEVERAAWTTVARAVMNLDEAVTKD